MDQSAIELVNREEVFRKAEKREKSRKRKDGKDEKHGTPKKTRRFEEPADKDAPADESPGMLTSQQIKSMMEKARHQIQQRKEQIKQISPNVLSAQVKEAEVHSVSIPGTEASLMDDAMEKAQKAAELQKRIQAKLALKPELLAGIQQPGVQARLINMAKMEKQQQMQAPKALILDDKGRTVDATGQVFQIPSRVPTLKANIRAKKQEEFRQKMHEKPTPDMTSASSKFFDLRVKQETSSRARKTFKFHDKGKFEQIAQKIRTKAQLEKLQGEIAQAAKRTGIQQASKLALITPKIAKEMSINSIPYMEWWDAYVMDQTEDNEEKISTSSDVITNLIEHPAQLKAPGSRKNAVPVIGTYLTKKERKKLRRMNRREALKDEQEKVRLGLVPAPEPKVKLSNLMRVLGTDAVQDPTKVEKHVRQQMAKRQRAHEQANAARKLTTEQKKEKRVKKLKESTTDGVQVAMYRIRSLRDPAKKFKIEMNSKQLYLTGCTVLHPDINIVVVEGGPKAQRRFQRLMTVRIKWDEEKKGKRNDADAAASADGNAPCRLIWEGQTKTKHFGDMTFKQCTTDAQARDFFLHHGVEHYWDLAHSQKILQE
uniref:U4/U6 small nuclear ribonucleoprotein Prp3-like n=1 Tax=Phallusia mammillata TaxID=59560 RepID=A0A6F9DQK8_9ASCI|nr:U4/U6 small nuclear ribonucleoprotein Prp3-like [Phallusia mammillata]